MGLVLIAVALMAGFHRYPQYALMTAPLRSIVVQQFSAAHTHFQSESQWQADNAVLHERLLRAEVDLQLLQAQIAEDKALRQLLHVQSSSLPLSLVARVVGSQGEPYVSHYTLNKGSQEGVHIGAPVVGEQGVLGQVIAVSAHESQAMLLTEKRSAIPVKNARTGWTGVAQGTGQGTLQLRHVLQAGTSFHVGDKLVTSGFAHVFPAGLPVATLVAIKAIHPFSLVTLHPVSELQSPSFVLVMEVSHEST